jgi:ribosomal protein L16 Arg81 hydroxylase
MMGHTVDTYHDIQSVGIDKLRNVYTSSGLAIRKKTQISKIDTLKEMIRALGMNPEQMLTRAALSQGATTYRNDEELQNSQLQMLSQQLRALIHQEASV